MATISFWGGVGTVTGSKYLIETDRARILVAEPWDVAVGLQLQPDGDERHSLELLVAAAWRADGRRICDRVVGHIMTRATTHPHSRCHP